MKAGNSLEASNIRGEVPYVAEERAEGTEDLLVYFVVEKSFQQVVQTSLSHLHQNYKSSEHKCAVP